MNAMQIKRGTTEDWSLGPELIHFEKLTVNGLDSTIHCENIHIHMNVYTNSQEKFPSLPSEKRPGLWLIQSKKSELILDAKKQYRMRLKVKGPSNCTVWFEDTGKTYSYTCAGGESLEEQINYPQHLVNCWVLWPEQLPNTEELHIYLSVREIGANETLAPGQLGVEYTADNKALLKVGMPNTSKWNELPYLNNTDDIAITLNQFSTNITNIMASKPYYDASYFASSSEHHFVPLNQPYQYKAFLAYKQNAAHADANLIDNYNIDYIEEPHTVTTYATDIFKCPKKLCINFKDPNARAYIYCYKRDGENEDGTPKYTVFWEDTITDDSPNLYDKRRKALWNWTSTQVINYFGPARLKKHMIDFEELRLFSEDAAETIYIQIGLSTADSDALPLEEIQNNIEFFSWDGENFGSPLYSNSMFVSESGNTATFNTKGSFSVIIPGQARHFVTKSNMACWMIIGIQGTDNDWTSTIISDYYKRRYVALPEGYEFFIARIFFLDDYEEIIPTTYVGDISNYCCVWLPTILEEKPITLDAQRTIQAAKKVNSLTWTPKRNILAKEYANVKTPRTYKTGVTYNGCPYGSNWQDARMIGWHVSPHTFVNAVNDINSVFYTNTVENGAPWYGNVCSSFATLSAGWPYPQTTAGFLYDPNVQTHFANKPEIGAIWSGPGHCVVPEAIEIIDNECFSITAHEGVTPISAATKRYSNFYTSTEDAWTFGRGAQYYDNYGYVVHHNQEQSGLPSLGTERKNSYVNFDDIGITKGYARPHKGDLSVYTNFDKYIFNKKEGNVVINLSDEIPNSALSNLKICVQQFNYNKSATYTEFAIPTVTNYYFNKVVYDEETDTYRATSSVYKAENPGGILVEGITTVEDNHQIYKDTTTNELYWMKEDMHLATQIKVEQGKIESEEEIYFTNGNTYYIYSDLDGYQAIDSIFKYNSDEPLIIKIPKIIGNRQENGEPTITRATKLRFYTEVENLGGSMEILSDMVHSEAKTLYYKVSCNGAGEYIKSDIILTLQPANQAKGITHTETSYKTNNGETVWKYSYPAEDSTAVLYYCKITTTHRFILLNDANKSNTDFENCILSPGFYHVWVDNADDKTSQTFEYIRDTAIEAHYQITQALENNPSGDEEIEKRNNRIPRTSVRFINADGTEAQFWYAQMWCEGDIRYEDTEKSVAVPYNINNDYSDWFQNGHYIRGSYSIFKQGRYGAYTVPITDYNELYIPDNNGTIMAALAADLIPFYLDDDLYILPRQAGSQYNGAASWDFLITHPSFQIYNYTFEKRTLTAGQPALICAKHKQTQRLYKIRYVTSNSEVNESGLNMGPLVRFYIGEQIVT